jgi:twitching motility protein PilT
VSTEAQPQPQNVSISDAIKIARKEGASDLHILGGDRIRIRADRRVKSLEVVVPQETVIAFVDALQKRDRSAAAKMKRLSAFDVREIDEQGGALRLHVFQDGMGMRLAIRLLGERPPRFDTLRLPPHIETFVQRTSGLIIIAGPQGSGKSSLQHSLVDSINRAGGRTVTIIEHPKEFQHVPQPSSVIVQQEPGYGTHHTPSYAQGVVSAMNADSNVIVIGQVTTIDEARAAVDAAVKGCLVIITIHARNAAQSLDSLLSLFPVDELERVRLHLAQTFVAAVALRLLPHVAGGVQAVAEVLVADEVTQRAIRQGEIERIRRQHMPQNRQSGNITLESALSEVVKLKRVREADAVRESVYPDELTFQA